MLINRDFWSNFAKSVQWKSDFQSKHFILYIENTNTINPGKEFDPESANLGVQKTILQIWEIYIMVRKCLDFEPIFVLVLQMETSKR